MTMNIKEKQISNMDEDQFFKQAENDWYLDKLYQDLETARGKILENTQKMYLRGILCKKSPVEIDREINPYKQDLQADGSTVRVTLNIQIYPSIRKICKKTEKLNYKSIVPWLTEAGYRKPTRAEIIVDTSNFQNELFKNMLQQFIDNKQLMDNPDFQEKVEFLKRELKEKTGFDYEILFFKKGSLIIGIEGTSEAIAKLAELFQSGELKELIGLPVVDVRVENNQAILTQDTEVNQLSATNENGIKLTQWFDNIKIDDWLYDIGIQSAKLALKSYQNLTGNIGATAPTTLRGVATPVIPIIALISLGGAIGAAAFLRGNNPSQANRVEGLEALTSNTSQSSLSLTDLIDDVLNSNNKYSILMSAYELGKLLENVSNIPQWLINFLATRITTIEDSETRWQLALTLGKLSPEHPLGAVGQTKTIEFPTDDWFDLFLALRVGEDDLIDVLIEVTSATDEYLPVGLQVSLLDETEELFSEAVAKEEERYLSLEFTGAIGQFFSVKFSLGGNDLIENFVI
jgi:GTPases - translation elongation factors